MENGLLFEIRHKIGSLHCGISRSDPQRCLAAATAAPPLLRHRWRACYGTGSRGDEERRKRKIRRIPEFGNVLAAKSVVNQSRVKQRANQPRPKSQKHSRTQDFKQTASPPSLLLPNRYTLYIRLHRLLPVLRTNSFILKGPRCGFKKCPFTVLFFASDHFGTYRKIQLHYI
jgi:hypothetical protein